MDDERRAGPALTGTMAPAPDQTEALARRIRCRVLRMVHAARASHVGSCFSLADILAVLYLGVMRFDAAQPRRPDRDRLILSKGHAAAALYSTLAEIGCFPPSDLASYGADGSLLMTHASHKVAGVEFSTGSLGHGLPFGVGKALAAKRHQAPWRTFVLLSDGEMNEGSNWEALMFAAHHGLDNLVAIIDYNKLQSLKSIDETLRLEPLAGKLAAFGWQVREVDGHDHQALRESLGTAPWRRGQPCVLIAHTVKGKGVSFMENRVEWHYRSPDADQLRRALAELEG